MKIPRYEQQVNAPSAPQFSQIADVRTDSLSALADGLQDVYQDKLREQEEAKKTAIFQADTSIKMAMQKAMFDLQERIKNGGSYAKAEEEYQKAHDTAIAQFGSAFDVDESGNTKARALAEYQADGLNNILRIREMASSRRRSDAASAANNRLDLLKREYALAGDDVAKREAAVKAMSGTIAGLSATGVINGDEGKMRLRNALSGAEADRLTLVAQNNADNPQKVLDEVEKSKDMLDVDTYLSMRGAAMADVAKMGTVASVESYIASPEQYKPPSQESVDLFYQEKVIKPMAAGAFDEAQYEQIAIDTSITTGKLPTQVVMQSSSFLNMTPEMMNDSDISTAASTARIVASASKQGAKVNMNGLTKDTIAKAELITSRIESGMDERKAIQSVYSDIGDDDRAKIYKTSTDEARKILVNQKLGDTSFSVDIPKLSQSEFVDVYAQYRGAGSTADEAVKLAKKKINQSFVKFDGIDVKDPATNYSQFDEESWVRSSRNYYETKIGKLSEGQKVAPIADRETKRLIAAGEKPSFGLYLYVDPKEPPIAVFDKETGQPIRIYETPEMKKKQKQYSGELDYFMRFK